MNAAFSPIWGNGIYTLIHRSFTVAVTARELHPLPYSLVAQLCNEHLKASAKNLSWFERAPYHAGFVGVNEPKLKKDLSLAPKPV